MSFPPCADHLEGLPFAPWEGESLWELPAVGSPANGEQCAHSVRACAQEQVLTCCKGSCCSSSWCGQFRMPYRAPRCAREVAFLPAVSCSPARASRLFSAGASTTGTGLLSAVATPDIDAGLPRAVGDPCTPPVSRLAVRPSSWTDPRDWASTPVLISNRQPVRKPPSTRRLERYDSSGLKRERCSWGPSLA